MVEETNKTPVCVGIIMDGNRRWARVHGLSALEGHRAGGETLKKMLSIAKDAGIRHMIFYTLSAENLNRSAEEVSYLFSLVGEYIEKELDHFHTEGGVLKCIGDLSKFPKDLQEKLKRAEDRTVGNSGPHIYFALNYGGRAEILSAVTSLLAERIIPGDLTEESFAKHLYTKGMPDPDLIIRTGGEQRLSGFLPWQSVYSELFFTKTFWPDFSKEEFLSILKEFGSRERRYGK